MEPLDNLASFTETDLQPVGKRLMDKLKWKEEPNSGMGIKQEVATFEGREVRRNLLFGNAKHGRGQYSYAIGNEFTTDMDNAFEFQLNRLKAKMQLLK